MLPRIEKAKFGSIIIDGITYTSDVIIRPDGQVKKRKKKLSKAIYGTSHTISLEEARHIYKEEAPLIIIGSGKFDRVRLSEEAEAYFKSKGCKVKISPTAKAVQMWNETVGPVIGLFHITC
jgi:hypothetical protein